MHQAFAAVEGVDDPQPGELARLRAEVARLRAEVARLQGVDDGR